MPFVNTEQLNIPFLRPNIVTGPVDCSTHTVLRMLCISCVCLSSGHTGPLVSQDIFFLNCDSFAPLLFLT